MRFQKCPDTCGRGLKTMPFYEITFMVNPPITTEKLISATEISASEVMLLLQDKNDFDNDLIKDTSFCDSPARLLCAGT